MFFLSYCLIVACVEFTGHRYLCGSGRIVVVHGIICILDVVYVFLAHPFMIFMPSDERFYVASTSLSKTAIPSEYAVLSLNQVFQPTIFFASSNH